MLKNVDEFLLCRPYVRIRALVVGRLKVASTTGALTFMNEKISFFFLLFIYQKESIFVYCLNTL